MKPVGFTVVVVALAGAGLIAASQVSAQVQDTDPRDTLIQKIATRFNLDQNEVKKVFVEHHDAMHVTRQERYNDYLSGLVNEGKITEQQQKLILEKRKELEDNFRINKESLINLSPEERRQKMEAARTELNAWAEQNGIDPQYLLGPMGKFKKGHFKMHLTP